MRRSWALDASSRHPASKRLHKGADAQTIASYGNPAWVLGSWSPALAPLVLSGPASVTVAPGQAATLSATVAAIPDAAYQWFRNGRPIAGATGKALAFAAVRAADAGTYTIAASNASGTTTSRKVTLTVKRRGLGAARR